MSTVPDWAESLARKISLRFPTQTPTDERLPKVIADHLNVCSLTLTTAHQQITLHDSHHDNADYCSIIGPMFAMLLMNGGASRLSVILAKAITTAAELGREIDEDLAEAAFRVVDRNEAERRSVRP